jgi:low temperature requirement protein LtrA
MTGADRHGEDRGGLPAGGGTGGTGGPHVDPAEHGKRAGFLELFFDLVFVFAVTQLVGVLHEANGVAGWARAALLLWLVWWAWSQYTWTGNAIDLDRRPARLVVLVASLAMLAAAVSLPQAFGDDALAFALPYVGVRLAGLALYWIGLVHDAAHRAALRTYLPVALLSPVLVLIGGVVGEDARPWWWSAAVVVDLVSVAAAGRGEFRVDASHFAERHGLVVIIALGESVVAMGLTAEEVGPTARVVAVLVAGFAVVAGFWWTYFDWVAAAGEARLARELDHRRRGNLARDLYTLGHLPIVAGVVVFAVAVEEALLHPAEPLPGLGVAAIVAGPSLFLAGFVVGNRRAAGTWLWSRIVGIVGVVVVGLVAAPRVDPAVALGLLAVLVATVASVESVRRRSTGPIAA